jgi:DNA polymerase/3'-5' exonuclease PolX
MSKLYFENLKFFLIQFGLDLGSKRISVLIDLIKKHGGMITTDLFYTMSNRIPDYIISSKKITKCFLLSFLKNNVIVYNSVKEKLILPDWVVDCIKFGKVLDTEEFKIRIEDKSGDEANYARRDIKKKRIHVEDDEMLKHNSSRFKLDVDMNFNKNFIEDNLPIPLAKKGIIKKSYFKKESRKSKHNNIDETLNTSEEEKFKKDFIKKISIGQYNKGFKHDVPISKDFEDNNIIDSDSFQHNNSTFDETELNLHKESTKSNTNTSQSEFRYTSKFQSNQNNLKSFTERNLNKHITDQLEKILDFHTTHHKEYEAVSYRRAISQIEHAKKTITSYRELQEFPYLGSSIKNKLKEFFTCGKIRKSDYSQLDNRTKALKQFIKIYGIGYKLANILYNKGIHTIQDLRQNSNLLNEKQKIGLKYFEDLSTRIKRKEVEEIFLTIKNELFKILPVEIISVEICGSYRRLKESIRDIDILITRKDEGSIFGILDCLIDNLQRIEFIKEVLSNTKSGNFRFQAMLICEHASGRFRRVDIKIYKQLHYPFALLYFTGSANFNRSMRLYANRRGYILTDLKLEFVGPNMPDRHNVSGKPILCKNEEDIFSALELDYIRPELRDI